MIYVLIIVVLVAIVAFLFLRKKPEQPPAPAAREPRAEPAKRPAAEVGPAATREAAPRAAATPAQREAAAPAQQAATATPAESPISSEETLDSSAELEELSAPEQERPDDSVDSSPPPPPQRGTPRPGSTRPRDLLAWRKGLAKSREGEGFFGRLRSLLTGRKEIPAEIAGELEELLLTSDVGVATTEAIIARIQERLSRGELGQEEQVWNALREEALHILDVQGARGGLTLRQTPTVVLFVGVNGAGKTTTIGKLAQKLSSEGRSVMLAAGDTFRAAAVDQLKAWGERTGVPVVSGKDNADPSSVLFDAIQAARNAGVDYLLADTAGRLHTKTNLMQEMTKIARTAGKALDGAPHEVFLVLDSTNGQNALAQAREFKEALALTGLVLTKLDGTARGGAVLGICGALQVPVRYVGLGEKPEDLREFSASDFVEALLGKDGDEIAA
ncbi:MAG TPA: signal recognition particle-docking protein FtsY [Polyangiaceae bacterium]|nr:signal recognition particle-docking protein FtsY [Polyangiaceae bacterium]